MNLLRNAADAMSGVDDRPRRLVIRTEPDADSRVRLIVQDAGVGFGADGAAAALRGFLHDQERRHGDRAVRQPLHHRDATTDACGLQANDGPGATFSLLHPRLSSASRRPSPSGASQAPVTSSAQNAAGIS